MKTIILILIGFIIGCKSVASPLIYEDEISVKLKDIKCITCINQSEIEINLLSGSSNKFQTNAIFKLSGKSGELGSQMFLKLNPYLWLGGEVSSNLNFDVNHKFYFAFDIKSKFIHFFPYVSFILKKQAIGGAGFKLYLFKQISLGFSYDLDHPEISAEEALNLSHKEKRPIRQNFSFSFGMKINKDSIKKLTDLTGFTKKDSKI